jgi:hypothetical protein
MLGQARDDRTGQGALAHVGERLGVDHVVAVAGPQHLQEVQPALRAGGGERGEVLVPQLGADAVLMVVAGAGVVDADPARRGQPGPQHLARLGAEGVPARVQQPHDLALGDEDADGPELGDQARNRDLALVVLGQYEPAQRRPEVADDPSRHRRRDGPAVGGQPALAAQADHVRAQHQVLDEEVLVTLEARAGRDLRRRDDPLLVDGEPPDLAALGTAAPALPGRLGLGRLFHAARLHLGPALQALERRDLGA